MSEHLATACAVEDVLPERLWVETRERAAPLHHERLAPGAGLAHRWLQARVVASPRRPTNGRNESSESAPRPVQPKAISPIFYQDT